MKPAVQTEVQIEAPDHDYPPGKQWLDNVFIPELVKRYMRDRLGIAVSPDHVANSERRKGE